VESNSPATYCNKKVLELVTEMRQVFRSRAEMLYGILQETLAPPGTAQLAHLLGRQTRCLPDAENRSGAADDGDMSKSFIQLAQY